ncbi:MAG TPA: hypothetical protein VNQ79_29220 [Blastocatellia bacterium]|nr:hypothetical protein [Blastocatellia bacterium]
MASTYNGFDLLIDNGDGTITPVPNETVHFYNVTADAAIAATVVSDANGHVPGGSLNVNAGTVVRYWFVTAKGICAYEETTTF